MKKLLFTALFLFIGVPTAYASHYDLYDIDLVPESVVDQLAAAKISNTEQLLANLMKKSDRDAFAKKYAMSEVDVDKLARKLELMQVVGIGPKAAELLFLAGIKGLQQLSEANDNDLLESLQMVNRVHNITGVQPDLTVVRDWIAKSKRIANHLQ
ncbi:MAG: DUF4332 domain-containing protein [Proteobacteria bacterium]|nr:DUF4332 domain-containing protein [Pseudomonadota bacterium]